MSCYYLILCGDFEQQLSLLLSLLGLRGRTENKEACLCMPGTLHAPATRPKVLICTMELASIDPSLSRREVLTKDSQKTLSKEADEAEQGPP